MTPVLAQARLPRVFNGVNSISSATRDLALTSYGQILRAASVVVPRNPWVTSRRARICARLAKRRRVEGDATRALALIDEALVQIPEDLRLLAARAGALHDLARYQAAEKAWRHLANLAPLDEHGWVGMAKALHMMGRAERIEAVIEEYFRVLGDRPDRYLRTARVALAGQRISADEKLLPLARSHARQHPVGLRKVAELLTKAGSVGEALNCLDEADQLARLDKASAANRERILRSLRLAGVEAASLPPQQRTALRMPDLALLTVVRRATGGPGQATGEGVVMVCSSLCSGGAQRQILNTLKGLHRLDSRRTITLMPLLDGDPVLHRFHHASLASLAVRIEPCPTARVDEPLLRAAIGSDAKGLLDLWPETLRADIGVLTSRFLRRPPEVVHAWGERQNITAGVAAVLAGVPRVILNDRSIAPAGSRVVPSYYRAVYTGLLEHPSTVLVNNSAAGASTYGQWLGIDPACIRVIYNGVEVEELERARNPEVTAAYRARLGLAGNAKVVGSLFRLSREKRPLLWLEAAAEVVRRCPEAHFVIVGEGLLRSEIVMAAGELGIADRLHMPGLTRDVAPWYDLMDVVLLTSRYEGTSNSVLEAQALGKPVVAPAVGGMPETFVPGTSGFLVSANPTPSEIAESVTRALTDTVWRHRAERVARSFVRKRFSTDRMIADTLEVYGFEPAQVAGKSYRAAD